MWGARVADGVLCLLWARGFYSRGRGLSAVDDDDDDDDTVDCSGWCFETELSDRDDVELYVSYIT